MLQLWFVANTLLWILAINVGGFRLQVNELLLLSAGTLWIVTTRKIAVSSLKVLLLLLVYLGLSFAIARIGPCTDSYVKSLVTGLLLLFLVLLGLETGRRATDRDWFKLQYTAIFSLVVAFAFFFVEFFMPSWFPGQVGYRSSGRFSGLFGEPSVAAGSMFPCIAVMLVAESKTVRRWGMVFLLGLLLFSRSSSLIAFIMAWVLYRLLIHGKLKQTALFALGIGILIAIGSALNYGRFIEPTVNKAIGITQSSEADNLSSLVYVQGWEDASENFVRTHGLGLGFNMMGCHPLPDVPARRVIALLGADSDFALNDDDGSTLAAKIVSEAGAFGIIFYLVVIWWWVRLETKIRRNSNDAGRFAAGMQAALIFCFVASSFIRSIGYFSSSFMLLVIAMSGASKWQQSLPEKPAEDAEKGAAPASL